MREQRRLARARDARDRGERAERESDVDAPQGAGLDAAQHEDSGEVVRHLVELAFDDAAKLGAGKGVFRALGLRCVHGVVLRLRVVADRNNLGYAVAASLLAQPAEAFVHHQLRQPSCERSLPTEAANRAVGLQVGLL